MASRFAEIKAKARRDVHASLSISARYESYSLDSHEDISIRWHNKQALVGDMDNGGYSTMIEGVERIIFMRSELAAKGIELNEGDSVTVTAEGFEEAKLLLKAREPIVGPEEVIWQVVRAQ